MEAASILSIHGPCNGPRIREGAAGPGPNPWEAQVSAPWEAFAGERRRHRNDPAPQGKVMEAASPRRMM